MQTKKSHPTLAMCLGVLFLGPAALAQSENPEPNEEAVKLSPFTVNAEADTGYAADSTLAGSRFRTELKDTPATVSVMTIDLLDDIGATDFATALGYSGSAQQEFSDGGADGFGSSNPNGNEFQEGAPTFKVRGQPTTKARDYFAIRSPIDLYNVERIESARGPNGILFGFGAPGGIINVTTKQARLDRSFGRTTASVSSHSSSRATLDLNRVLADGKLAVRLNLLYDDAHTFQHYTFDRDKRYNIALKYKPTDTLTVRAQYEGIEVRRNKPRAFQALDGGFLRWNELGRPTTSVSATNSALNVKRQSGTNRLTYVTNTGVVFNGARTLVTTQPSSGVQTTIIDTAIADPSINYGGPGQINQTDAEIFSTFVEKRIGDDTFVELAYNHQSSDLVNYQPGQSNMKLWGDPDLTLFGGSNPYAGQIFMETASGIWERQMNERSSDLFRLTVSTELDFGDAGHYQFAVLADHDSRTYKRTSQEEAWEGTPFHSKPENSRNGVRRRTYVTEGDWSTYYIEGPLTTGLLSGVADPTTPGRTLNSTWINKTQSQQDDPETQTSFVVAMQARYWDGRVIVSGGYRRDDLDITDRTAQRDPITNEWSLGSATTVDVNRKATSYSAGLVAHLTDEISFFYNRANNQGLPGNQRVFNRSSLSSTGIAAPVTKGEGMDVGLAYRLPDNKLEVRVAYFQSDAKDLTNFYGGTGIGPSSAASNILDALQTANHITAAEEDARTPNVNGALYDQVSDGFEVSAIVNPSKEWKIRFNYSYADSHQSNYGLGILAWMNQEIPFWQSFNAGSLMTNQGRTIDEAIAFMQAGYNETRELQTVGEPGHRQHKASLFTRYDISSGMLKGGYVGGGYRYQSGNLIGITPAGSGIFGNSLWKADLLFGYKFDDFKLGFFDGLKLQVNVYNVFDEHDLIITRQDGATGNIRRAIVQSPRTWRFQATMDF